MSDKKNHDLSHLIQKGRWEDSLSSNIGEINEKIYAKLVTIERSYSGGIPCDVELINGEKVKNVYFLNARKAFDLSGDYYLKMGVYENIDIKSINEINPSRNRLSKNIRKKINDYKETGMGYVLFYFVMKNGEKVLAIHVGAYDFFDFNNYERREVVDVEEFDRMNYDSLEPEINPEKIVYCYYNLQGSMGSE